MRIRLVPCCPSSAFKPVRLGPTRNSLRSVGQQGESDDTLSPTPMYNHSILEVCVFVMSYIWLLCRDCVYLLCGIFVALQGLCVFLDSYIWLLCRDCVICAYCCLEELLCA